MKVLYLEPEDCCDKETGSLWCQDKMSCDNCGKPWVKYVRADLVDNLHESDNQDSQG